MARRVKCSVCLRVFPSSLEVFVLLVLIKQVLFLKKKRLIFLNVTNATKATTFSHSHCLYLISNKWSGFKL